MKKEVSNTFRLSSQPLLVQKYGGSSVATISHIQKIAEHIRKQYLEGFKLVIVISAMGEQTDELLDLAHQITPNPNARELDILITAGERISMSLLSIALHTLQIPCCSFTGSQSGIITDAVHGNARIKKVLGDRIRSALSEDQVVIVAGFQGVCDETKDITTLGRGGSDLTAVALAHSLQAKRCELYKDVDGLYTENPKKIPRAKKIPQISSEALAELCWAGSQILHARSLHLATKFQIPLLIRSSLNFDQDGTMVTSSFSSYHSANLESFKAEALTHKGEQCLWGIETEGDQALVFNQRVRDWLWLKGEVPSYFNYSKDPLTNRVELTFLISQKYVKTLNEFLEDYAQSQALRIFSSTQIEALSWISIVGFGFQQAPELLQSITKCISSFQLFAFELQSNRISFLLPQLEQDAASKKLHQLLFET